MSAPPFAMRAVNMERAIAARISGPLTLAGQETHGRTLESLDLSRPVRLGCFPSIPAGREARMPAALTLWSEEGGHD